VIERKTGKPSSRKRISPPRAVRSGDGHKQTPFKLVTRRQIRAVVDRIVEALHPEKVILFGSYAYGKPTIDSDVDILIVMESDERPAKRAYRAYKAIWGKSFPMDILVRTPMELAHRLEINDYFMEEVIERGQVLYERRDTGAQIHT
jgi:predicted nucleotidyltransferase